MLQLLHAGKSMNEICRELSMSKRTVHSYKQRVVATGMPLQSLRKLDDTQLNTTPPKTKMVTKAHRHCYHPIT